MDVNADTTVVTSLPLARPACAQPMEGGNDAYTTAVTSVLKARPICV